MNAQRITVRSLWVEATYEVIRGALQETSGPERDRCVDEDLAEWIKSTPASVADAIRSGVEKAAQAGIIDEDEAGKLERAIKKGGGMFDPRTGQPIEPDDERFN